MFEKSLEKSLNIFRKVLEKSIVFYQRFLSPLKFPCCRFHPSCSAYAAAQLAKNAPLPALLFSALRILRCQPLCKGGFDYPRLRGEAARRIRGLAGGGFFGGPGRGGVGVRVSAGRGADTGRVPAGRVPVDKIPLRYLYLPCPDGSLALIKILKFKGSR